MYDWTEQLFKHEGMCVWNDDDAYSEMSQWMENWPTSCTQLYKPDYDGNTIYFAVHPLPQGNMTLEIYTDEQCTTVSPYMDLSSYIIQLYSQYDRYYGTDRGSEVAAMYTEAIHTEAIQNWNEKMSTFKVCQPCKAYNLYSDQENNEQHEKKGRFLENDGDGETQERFNCYDDAGYTNVNQCYKFETQTSLELADEDDLAVASEQGTILRIKASGQVYGEGGYVSPMTSTRKAVYISLAVAAAIGIAACVLYARLWLRRRRRKKVIPSSLRETFYNAHDGKDAEVGLEVDKNDTYVAPSTSDVEGGIATKLDVVESTHMVEESKLEKFIAEERASCTCH